MRSTWVLALILSGLIAALPAKAQVGMGPNHKPGAPFRAKLSPPLADGTVLLVRGHVRDKATGNGVDGAVLDAWQADATGQYHLDDFDYRARVITDESGYFEIETIVPSNYGPPPHIHMIVTAPGYSQLVTEMLFRDREHPTNENPELTPKLVERKQGAKTYFESTFDVTLRPGT